MDAGSLGLGTYLGAADEAVDERYEAAARAFHAQGGRVFDTAANYRGGRSEEVLGRVFRTLRREAFFVSTKAGYLPMEEHGPGGWRSRLVDPGILDAGEVVDGCHAMAPRYLEHQLDVSLRALGVDRVDCFHLHNPEQQRPSLGAGPFREAMRRAFEACEDLAGQGKVGAYGCATWNGFRVPPDSPEHLSLADLADLAREAGGAGHHFRWIQLPLNLALPEAFLAPTQEVAGHRMTILEAARALGFQVQVSASLMQGRILSRLPAPLLARLGQGQVFALSPAQGALQFVRSCPGVTAALCGMSRVEHVAENGAVAGLPLLDPRGLRALFP